MPNLPRPIGVLLLFIFSLTGCGWRNVPSDEREAWLAVLEKKKVIRKLPDGSGSSAVRQEYANAVASFISRYPSHRRGRQTYAALQADFARRLVASGRLQESIPHFRSALLYHPEKDVRVDLERTLSRMHPSSEQMATLRRGMSHDEVREVLGPPPPGWTETVRRNGRVTEGWYYRRKDGRLASVFFTNGRLFAAEYETPLQLLPESGKMRGIARAGRRF